MINSKISTVQLRSWCQPVRRDRSRKKNCCVTIDKPPERPDPAIYSQHEQLALGSVPSWDSPDIVTNHWSPWRLFREPEVTVRNLSPTASALNTLVHFSISPFGIGMVRTLLSSRMVNLPPGSQTTLKFPLGQDTLDGSPEIGAYIVLEHPHDNSLINSKGDQIHKGVFTSEAGRNLQFTLPVRNPLAQAQQISLSVSPNDLGATVTPAVQNVGALTQVNVQVAMTVPASLQGTPANYLTRDVTIIGRDAAGNLIDGATFLIRIDD